MRTKGRILKKISAWKGNPMMVAGLYRLFTYVPWEDIPEEYKKFFPDGAELDWDKDLETFDGKNIQLDVESEIKAILKLVTTRNITHALGLIPIVLADTYAYGVGVSPLQAQLLKLIAKYKENIELDRELAEQLALLDTVMLFKTIVKKLDFELSFNIDDVAEQLMREFDGKRKSKKKDKSIEAAVDLALAKEKTEIVDEDSIDFVETLQNASPEEITKAIETIDDKDVS